MFGGKKINKKEDMFGVRAVVHQKGCLKTSKKRKGSWN